MVKHYDLIALGGGSGGIAAAKRAAQHGARCAVIEADKLGGTCVNRGCVPKKILWHAAEFAHALRLAPAYGFDVRAGAVDWAMLRTKRNAYLKRLNQIYRSSLSDFNIDIVAGHGRFVDAHTLEAGGRHYSADHIVIATGGRPRVPDLPGAGHGITSDDFFELPDRPERVVIVGSGYIAVETACLLNALGSEVTIMMRRLEFLNGFDAIIRRSLMEEMQHSGINILSSLEVRSITREDDGSLALETSREHRVTGVDCLLWAVGRIPNTDNIALGAAGVATDEAGHIAIDDYQDTNVPGIHAIGDVTGQIQLTPVAIAAGRRLADRLFGNQPGSRLDLENVPTVIFSHPPAASVGISEEAARSQHGDAIKVYTHHFTPLLHAMTAEKSRTAIKLVTLGFEEKIIGCHIVGLHADEMLQGFAVAIRMGACKKDFDNTIAIHPTSAEELVLL